MQYAQVWQPTNDKLHNLNLFTLHDVLDDSINAAHSSLNNFYDKLYPFDGEMHKTDFCPIGSGELMFGSDFSYCASAGINFMYRQNNFSSTIYPRLFYSDYLRFIGEKFDSMNVFPYLGKTLFSFNNSYGGLSVPIYLKYDAGSVFTFEAGNGKAFLGDGYRSIILSDQSAEYPFVRITANIKNVKYMHQIARWRQETFDNHNETKYAATHYLSWMITKKLNFSIFESIVWKAQDSVRQRGFEWMYLNPVLFFRPAEFAIGSPDNNMLGGNISWSFLPKSKLYGQFALDEFFISEIKNWIRYILHPSDPTIQYGAWVNKHAFQLGIKFIDVFSVKDLNCFSEFNYVRPYIGSHRDPVLSYTHMNQPIAHPYGANFHEFIFHAEYGKGGWQGLLNASYYVTGLDSAGTHFGQNLLQSTFDSPLGNGNIPVQYYGNHVGQGIKHNILQVNAELRKSFHVLNNAFVWRIGALYRIDKTSFENKSDKYIYTGLFLNINPDHWNMR